MKLIKWITAPFCLVWYAVVKWRRERRNRRILGRILAVDTQNVLGAVEYPRISPTILTPQEYREFYKKLPQKLTRGLTTPEAYEIYYCEMLERKATKE